MDTIRKDRFEKLFNSWREKFRQAIMNSDEMRPLANDIFDFTVRYGRSNLELIEEKYPTGFEHFVKLTLNDVCEDLQILKPEIFTDDVVDGVYEIGEFTLDRFVENTESVELHGDGTNYDVETRFGKKRFAPMDFEDPRQRNK